MVVVARLAILSISETGMKKRKYPMSGTRYPQECQSDRAPGREAEGTPSPKWGDIHKRLVLQRLLENKLFVNGDKCESHIDTVSFSRLHCGEWTNQGRSSQDPGCNRLAHTNYLKQLQASLG